MHTNHAPASIRFKVGIFAVLGLLLIGAATIFVNDRPYWWRQCQLRFINVEDATGLKMKSPVRSLGINIGYLDSIELFETHVRLGICITAPVEVLPSTRAYLKGEGFLGDKFVELRPVRYVGGNRSGGDDAPRSSEGTSGGEGAWLPAQGVWALGALSWISSTAVAGPSQEIPVAPSQDMNEMIGKVDELVEQMTDLTGALQQAINPKELRATLNQLNRTLESASRTLAPESGLNSTAQRTLAKLEDAIEQMRDQLLRINRGEGTVGRVLNDPAFADELMKALRNTNKLLNRASDIDFMVDLATVYVPAYERARGWFQLSIWPDRTRYYKLGVSVDPRGRRTDITTTTTTGGNTTTTFQTQVERGGILLTGMLGKTFFRGRLDFSAGVLFNDGAASMKMHLGPRSNLRAISIENDLYSPSRGAEADTGLDYRGTLRLKPFARGPLHSLYLMGGVESLNRVNGDLPYFYGAGISFSDEDIRLLFVLQ